MEKEQQSLKGFHLSLPAFLILKVFNFILIVCRRATLHNWLLRCHG